VQFSLVVLSCCLFENQNNVLSRAEKLEAERCATLRARRIPCMILTGFLGSGKTTLLNRILRSTDRKLAVIENEVGEVGVDDKLLDENVDADMLQRGDQREDEIILLPNGCMCCRVRGDLRKAFERVVASAFASTATGTSQERKLGGVILELSGLSEIGPVVQTFFEDSFVQSVLQLDCVVCVLDALHLEKNLLSDSVLIREQLSLADVAILNKVDAISPADAHSLQERIADINSTCSVFPLSLISNAPLPNTIFGEGNLMRSGAFSSGVNLQTAIPENARKSNTMHAHDKLGYHSICVQKSSGKGSGIKMYLDKEKLSSFLDIVHEDEKALAKQRNQMEITPIVRYKGVLFTGPRKREALQGLYENLEYFPLPEEKVPSEEISSIVFIGPLSEELCRRLDEGVRKCFTKAVFASASMSSSVPSVRSERPPAAPPKMHTGPAEPRFAKLKSSHRTMGGGVPVDPFL